MDRLGIEFISALGLPPVDFVHLAADLGIGWIGLAPRPIVGNPHGYPDWSLTDDPGLVRAVRQALDETGVRVSLGEGFLVQPGQAMRDIAPLFDLMAALGAVTVNCASIEQDEARNRDELGVFAAMASERGLAATLEFAPIMVPRDLPAARAAIAAAGSGLRLCLDMLHLGRAGVTAADLAALDPDEVGYIQLCDALPDWTMESYAHEARAERLAPGDGALPLAEWLALLPHDRVVGLELPSEDAARAGIADRDRLAAAIATTRALLP